MRLHEQGQKQADMARLLMPEAKGRWAGKAAQLSPHLAALSGHVRGSQAPAPVFLFYTVPTSSPWRAFQNHTEAPSTGP